MREIKFRAWDGERMKEVLTLGLNEGFVSTSKTVASIEDFELMQYTGLKDTNNKEIYEGDILLISDGGKYFPEQYNEKEDKYEPTGTYKVIWNEDGACFSIEEVGKTEPYEGDVSPFYDYAELEVIGNIYSNPELLTC